MVRDLTAAARFSQASVEARLRALLDSGAAQSLNVCNGLSLAEGSIGKQRVRIALTDAGLDQALAAGVVDEVLEA